MKTAAFQSDFAILDVKKGRRALENRLNEKAVHVLVEMIIEYVHGHDDGVSQEFSCQVKSVREYAA
jgi:hypothetical protein